MKRMLESVDTVHTHTHTHNIFYKRTKKGKENCLHKLYTKSRLILI